MSSFASVLRAKELIKKTERTDLTVEALMQSFLDNLFFVQGRSPERATRNDLYMALAHSVRDRLVERWISTVQNYSAQDVRIVCYLSAEFLTGPHLANNLINLGIHDEAKEAMNRLGLDLDVLIEQEEEPGLGNGGLGRLASCFMDSLATLDIPAIGYGIRYEYGIFDQVIRDGWQVETTDKWLRLGNPWEVARPEDAFEVKFGGHTESHKDATGRLRVHWIPDRAVRGVPHDTPILGYRTNTANTMRLWAAEAVESFSVEVFNAGDFVGAVADKVASETISKVLYPNDEEIRGKQLRLAQQFFFVSCSLQHILRIHTIQERPLTDLHRKFAIQLNDTHPAIAVAELMRLLVDERNLERTPLGTLRRIQSPTPTTPSFRKRWSSGPSTCLESYCRVTWKLFSKSTSGIWMKSGQSSPVIPSGLRGCPLSTSKASALSAWRILLP